MEKESIFNKHYVYGDQLGRITGDGRFNNVNSIIVNSHRIFLPKKYLEENQDKDYKNDYKYNNVFSNSFKSNDLNYNISYDNKFSKLSNSLKSFSPTSFSSIKNDVNKISVAQSFNKPINNYSNYFNNKGELIEKIFYNYNKSISPSLNNLHPSNNYYSLDKNNIKDYYLNKYSTNYKPEITESKYFKSTYSSLKKNESDPNFNPYKSYDFHNIYSKEKEKFSQPLINLSPNIIYNSTNKPNEKLLKTKYLNPNESTTINCTSVNEYTIKKIQNIKYNQNQNIFITCIDKFETKLYQGLFCLFNGINGNEVSKYSSETFPDLFERNIRYNPKIITPFKIENNEERNLQTPMKKAIRTSIETIFLRTFLKFDDDIKYMNCLNVGSSACVVFITNENENITGFDQIVKTLYCANIGDVECVIINKMNVKFITTKHNLDNEKEKDRIRNIGGSVFDNKIYGQVNITRNFGLFNLKSYGITAVPDVYKVNLSDKDKFVIIGTNSVFSFISPGDLLSICNGSDSSEFVSESIIRTVLLRNIKENLGLIVIKL